MVNLVVVPRSGDARLCLQINTYEGKDLKGETVSLTRGFSKCSLLPSIISNPQELVGNANDRASPSTYDPLTLKLWTWDQ